MNKYLEVLLTILILLAVIIIFIFPMIRIGITSRSLYANDICKLELGENWKYEYNNDFGSTCIELDYINLETINRTKYNFSMSEMLDKYCMDSPKFFELKRWDNGCNINEAYEVASE